MFVFAALNLFAADRTVSPGEDIQDAIDYVATNGGGTVTLESGTWTVSSPLKIRSNVTLQGSGTWASKIKVTTNIHIIDGYEEGMSNVTIQNLELEGTNASDGGGIMITSLGENHNNVKVLNVNCHNTGWGVHIKGADNVTIEDCLFEYNGTAGKEGYAHNMYLRRCSTVVVQDSRFMNSISANGINISYSDDINIYNCEMTGNYFRGVRAANTTGFLVHDCVVMNNGDVGIYANSEGVVTTGLDWENNCVSGNDYGMRALSGATGVVKNNNSYGNNIDYSITSAVSTSNNISDASQACNYDGGSTTPPTSCGNFNAFSRIEAEDYCSQSGIKTESCSEGGLNVGYIDDGDWIKFDDVDFDNGAGSVDVRVASKSTGGTIQFRLGSTSGTLIGTASVPVTGDWQDWETVSATVSGASGTQDLYLVFTEGGINVNWFEFAETGSTSDCDLPWTRTDFSVNVRTVAWTSSAIDISCESNVKVSVDLEGLGNMENSDYCNVYYQIDGGPQIAVSENTDTFAEKTVSVDGISGNSLKLIFKVYTDDTDEIYNVSDILVEAGDGSAINTLTIQENTTGFCSVDGTIDNNNAGFTGTGFANTANASGNGVDWKIDGSAGSYTFKWKYACTNNRPGNLLVNGSTVASNVAFNSTGSWSTWSTTGSTTVTLGSGAKTIRLQATTSSGLGNIDYMEVTGPGAVVSSCSSSSKLAEGKDVLSVETSTENSRVSIYPNPSSSKISVVLPISKFNNYTIYDISGRATMRGLIANNLDKMEIDVSKLSNGIYLISLKGSQTTETFKFVKE